MGVNYYRIPKVDDINRSYQKFMIRLQEMDRWDPHMVMNGYRFIVENEQMWYDKSPWDEFTEDMSIHLGKRSMGWKFCWNFHDNKYYKNKEELLNFIREGRVVDEYGQQIDSEEFIEMALEWGQPNGWVADKEYFESIERTSFFNSEDYYDKEIDGLRVAAAQTSVKKYWKGHPSNTSDIGYDSEWDDYVPPQSTGPRNPIKTETE